jgi:hypothetical protein
LDRKNCRAVIGHADIGQFAGTISPGLEQTDCIRPLMHWQLHFASTSVEHISPRMNAAIIRNRLVGGIAYTIAPEVELGGAVRIA